MVEQAVEHLDDVAAAFEEDDARRVDGCGIEISSNLANVIDATPWSQDLRNGDVAEGPAIESPEAGAYGSDQHLTGSEGRTAGDRVAGEGDA
jgi:hypothetical protein